MPADLFGNMNEISSQSYETAAALGHILIAAEDTAAQLCRVRFASRQPLRGARAIRKILETTDGSNALVTDGAHAFGLGDLEAAVGVTFDVSIVDHAT